MGVTRRLSGVLTTAALRRVHVLLVEVPGWWSTRVAAQQQLSARGWQEASSPADADLLLVCGRPGDGLGQAVAQVWDQLPGPRALERAERPEDVAGVLDRAAAVLGDADHQHQDARDRADDAHDVPDPDHADMDHGDDEMPDMDHGDMSAMDHGDMDHGDMDMAPAGIPLAGGGEDRDGLEMDVLQVPLGPVLPCWPAGLVLHCSLQGDVVVTADVEVLTAGSAAPDRDLSARSVAARRCDQAGQVLRLAGWEAAAGRTDRVRDDLLAGADLQRCRADLGRVTARVARSRLLRWSLRDLGRAGGRDGAAGPAGTGDDVHDRLLQLLRTATDLLRDDHELRGDPDDRRDGTRWTGTDPEELPRLVTGLDLAAVRLVVASLAPDTARQSTAGVDGA